MYSFSLRFKHDDLELAFMDATLARTRLQGQVAILVGMFVYLLHGGLDQWFVAADQARQVWLVRLTAMCVPLLVLLISFSRHFSRIRHLLLALVGLAAGVGLLGMQIALPLESAPYFYPMMVLVTFYTYNFIGTRFIYAFCIDLLLLLLYNLLFGWLLHYPPHVLLGHDFFIISANLIGGAAGYLNERQRRLLFLRERELDDERQQHLARALHDGLTGLPNRELLYDRIGQAIESAHRDGARHCGYFLDLDGFKAVNDGLGHEMGDIVLRTLAARLVDCVRQGDTVARYGGDEFVMLVEGEQDVDWLAQTAERIIQSVRRPIQGHGRPIRITASVGIALYPEDGNSAELLLRRADLAMYQAKHAGKDQFCFYRDCPPNADEGGLPG